MKPDKSSLQSVYIGIDLDGTLAQYDGWRGEHNFGSPMPGALEAVRKLKADGYKIVIWTTRKRADLVKAWLEKHQVPYDFINENPEAPPHSRKVMVDCYVDDRAIRFHGDWHQAYREIKEFVEKNPPPDYSNNNDS